MTWPTVLHESTTLALVCAGKSLARYGDGEFKIAKGRAIKSQTDNRHLAARLRELLRDPPPDCLVAIPNIGSSTPKAYFWNRVAPWALPLLAPGRQYASSFVSRPDSAPWINTAAYWAQMAGLWRGQAVTVVRGSDKSLTKDRLEADGAGPVTEILAPRLNAWGEYDELLARIGTPARALLCLGPTATVLAADLAARGVHAIDLGHAGMFLRRWQEATP